MKRFLALFFASMLLGNLSMRADETITVSATSSDISQGLDLKVVANLFAEAKNLEEFEQMLNNPDSAYCNLDLNGDGEVDYLRVVETGEGNKRLIVLQAILAKDIYQDVASIYVEKSNDSSVTVQVIGDEYVYGENYIIEPVYIYRPVIYDWFWGTHWYAWHSPYYWDYYPIWWHAHGCWTHDLYWHHCWTYHHTHHYCSFHHGHTPHAGVHEMRRPISRQDYAHAHPNNSFHVRNAGVSNARALRSTDVRRDVDWRTAYAPTNRTGQVHHASADMNRNRANTNVHPANRTFGSSNVANVRSHSNDTRITRAPGSDSRSVAPVANSTRMHQNATTNRTVVSANRVDNGNRNKSNTTVQTRQNNVRVNTNTTTYRSASANTNVYRPSSNSGNNRSSSSSVSNSPRSSVNSASTTYRSSSSSNTGNSSNRSSSSSYSGSSNRSSSSSYSGSSNRSSYSGGSSHSSSSYSGGGGGARTSVPSAGSHRR